MNKHYLLIVVFRVATSQLIPEDFSVDRTPRLLDIPVNGTIRISHDFQDDDGFLLFEAHCRTSRILMSFVQDIAINNYVNSTNPSLVLLNINEVERENVLWKDPGVYIHNPHNYSLTVYAMVKAFSKSDPVPGWCSPKDPYPSSYLTIDWNSAVIRVNFSRAGLLGDHSGCNNPKDVQYKVYQSYIPVDGNETQQEHHFKNIIQTFSKLEDVQRYGTLVSSLGVNVNRLIFASYSPKGSIYAVVAELGNGTSLYSLGHTYGCNLELNSNGKWQCPDESYTIAKVASACTIFMGIVLAFAGHRFFFFSQFLFGFYAGSFIGYILLSDSHIPNYLEIYILTLLCGLALGLLIASLWFFFGIPVLSVLIPTLEVGVIVASVILFFFLNIHKLTIDMYYWLVFLCLTLLPPILLLAFTQKASILSSVIVGSTSIAMSVGYFLNTGLVFIFINIVRRASVPRFHEALLVPSLEKTDLILIVGWLTVCAAALVTQLLLERKKPPFPPSPFQQWRWRREIDFEGDSAERSPLLPGSDRNVAEAVQSPVVGYIIGHRPVTGLPQEYSDVSRYDNLEWTLHNHVSSNRSGLTGSSRGRDIFKPPAPEERRYEEGSLAN